MKRILLYGGKVIMLLLLLQGCAQKKTQPVQPPEISVVNVMQKDIPLHKEFVGQIYGEKDIPIRARVDGYLNGIYFKEGFSVKKGELLYSIDPEPLQARVNTQRSRVAEANTELAKAKSDLDRYIPLAESNAVSKSDLDAAQAHYDAAKSSLEAAKSNLKSAQIELGYTKIYSPIDGIIGRTEAKVGDYVGKDPNPVILNTVSSTKDVKVRFFLTESEYLTVHREISELRKKQELKKDEKIKQNEDNLELILSDGTKYEHKGNVDFIDRGIDPSTGTMLVQADFPNPDRILRPGMFAKVNIEVQVVKGALLVPQRCISELQGQNSVFIVNDSNKVEARQITIGARLGDLCLVEKGLEASNRVVIDALQKVKTGMQVKPVETEFKSQTIQQ